MSCSTLLRVFKTKASWDVELHNSMGAGILWRYLAEVYKEEIGEHVYVLEKECMRRLAAVIDKESTPLSHRLAWHLMCWHSIILTTHLSESVAPLKEFATEISRWADSKNFVNHWPSIARFVEQLAKKHDKRMIGFAINATSVADDWDNYPRCGQKIYTSDYLFHKSEEQS